MSSLVSNSVFQSPTAAAALITSPTTPVEGETTSKVAQIASLYAKLHHTHFTQSSPMEFGRHYTAATKLIECLKEDPLSDSNDYTIANPHTIKWSELSEEVCIDLFQKNVKKMVRRTIENRSHYALKMAYHLLPEELRDELSSKCNRDLNGILALDFYLEVQPFFPERWRANLLQTAFISFIQKDNYPLAKGRCREVIESLSDGDLFFLRGSSHSHARIYAIKKENESYELAIIDTGQGLTEVEGEGVALVYQGLDKQQLLNNKMLDLLIKKSGGFFAANPFPKINQAIQERLGQEPTHRRIVLQGHRTCVANSLMEAFNLYASAEEKEVLKKRWLNCAVVQIARAQLQLIALGKGVEKSSVGIVLKQDINCLTEVTSRYLSPSEVSVELPQGLRLKFQELVLKLMTLIDKIRTDPQLKRTLTEVLKSQEQGDSKECSAFDRLLQLIEKGEQLAGENKEYWKGFGQKKAFSHAQEMLAWGEELCKLVKQAFEGQGRLFESVEEELSQARFDIEKLKVRLMHLWATQEVEIPLQRRSHAKGEALLEGQFNTLGDFFRGQAHFTDGATWEGEFDPTLREITLRYGKMRLPDGSILAGNFRGNRLFNGTSTRGEEVYEVKNGHAVLPKEGKARREREG